MLTALISLVMPSLTIYPHPSTSPHTTFRGFRFRIPPPLQLVMIVYVLPICSKLRWMRMSLVFDAHRLERLFLENYPPSATVYLTTWVIRKGLGGMLF
jgi:hypothetical protein